MEIGSFLMEGMEGVKGTNDLVDGMEQDTSSNTAPTRVALNQVAEVINVDIISVTQGKGVRLLGDWGWQPRARELAFVAQREEKGTRRGAPRPLRRR
jgi:hypothetical protein